jgi:LemA protein
MIAFVIFLIFSGLLLLALVGYLIGIYNQLIQIKVNIEKAWGNIEVMEKQRYDEIPKLVKICEGYMQYEKETLQKVTEARTKFMEAKTPAAMAQASGEIAGALKTLFAVAENYPQLKADQNFVHLQGRVTALENQIADRREFYNESVAIFNTRIRQFPDMIVANMLNYSEREMYKVAEGEKKSPDISFNLPK